MSAVNTAEAAPSLFNKTLVFWGVLASLLAAAGFFLLATYAPDFRLGRQGGESPMSKSGVGFAGISKLLDVLGQSPELGRGPIDELGYDDNLMIVTISADSDAEILGEIIKAREGMPTLFVLPKWRTVQMQAHEGWEMRLDRLSGGEVNRLLASIGEFRLATKTPDKELLWGSETLKAPLETQSINATGGLINAGSSNAVLLQLPERGFYILADPDLINNQGLKDPAGAQAAVQMIETLRPDDAGITFDLTLHGAGRKHDMWKLLVEPPFLALTLAILIAAALAFFHGLGRFGPALPETRAIPFGKRALVDTTATLLRRAGRLDQMGGRYAALMRARAGALLGAPSGLQGEALDQWLESRDKGDADGYSSLTAAARSAQTEADTQITAQRLHQWIARRIGESR